MKKQYDLVIIGGGIYGTLLALHLKKVYPNILLIEESDQLLSKASYFNQARVHNGYHYPRSFITAIRSHQNFVKFCQQFKPAIVKKYPSLYAIAKQNSKVTSLQFEKFCQMIGTPIETISYDLKQLFNPNLIEEVFQVEEFEFDAAILRKILYQKIKKNSINLSFNTVVEKVFAQNKEQVGVVLSTRQTISASKVINCTYAGINTILKKSQMPLIPVKLEYTEMPLVKLPIPLRKYGITVMDGPFFSLLPFPDRKLHSFHHVRYTPHASWYGTDEDIDKENLQTSHFQLMLKDAQRYIPLLKDIHSADSLFQTKAILKMTENNDGRPIYYHKNYQIPNFHLVLGGKIDNVYDIIEEINLQGL